MKSDKPILEVRQDFPGELGWSVYDVSSCFSLDIMLCSNLDERTAILFAAAEEMAEMLLEMGKEKSCCCKFCRDDIAITLARLEPKREEGRNESEDKC